MVYIVKSLLRAQKAVLQITVGTGQLLQIFRRNVEDGALIKIAAGHDGTVNAAAAHQHIIAGTQRIALALDGVIRPAGQQKNDLMKGMVMIRHLLMPVVRQMKQAERLAQVAALFIG